MDVARKHGVAIILSKHHRAVFEENAKLWRVWFLNMGATHVHLYMQRPPSDASAELLIEIAHSAELPLRENTILVQTEKKNSFSDTGWRSVERVKSAWSTALLVWECMPKAARAFLRAGMRNVMFVPCTMMMPVACTETVEKDIDVLFVATRTDYRWAVINKLLKAGLKVHCPDNVRWVEESRELMKRAKVWLNVHTNISAPDLELHRIMHAAGQRIVTVSEKSNDPQFDACVAGAVTFAAITNMTEACIEATQNWEEKSQVAALWWQERLQDIENLLLVCLQFQGPFYGVAPPPSARTACPIARLFAWHNSDERLNPELFLQAVEIGRRHGAYVYLPTPESEGCFGGNAAFLTVSLKMMGVRCEVGRKLPVGTKLTFEFSGAIDPLRKLSPTTVVLQTHKKTNDRHMLLNEAQATQWGAALLILDHWPANALEIIEQTGLTNVACAPVLFSMCRRVENNPGSSSSAERQSDIVIVAPQTARRQFLIERLLVHGMSVGWTQCELTAEQSRLEARTKGKIWLVINADNRKSALDTHHIVHAAGEPVVIVAEHSEDVSFDEIFAPGVQFFSNDLNLVDVCKHALLNWDKLASAGAAWWGSINMSNMLCTIFDTPPPV